MSLEKIQTLTNIEENKKFEELSFTRDFGDVTEINAKETIKKNFDYWRLPTIAELSALRKQNKSNFFGSKTYWASDFIDKDISNELRVVEFGILGTSWHFATESGDSPKHLVMVKKGTKIIGVEEEIKKLSESYPF
jgi:hypothetical protein